MIAEAVAAWRTAADAHTSGRRPQRSPWPIMSRSRPPSTTARAAERKVAALDERLDTDERRLRDLIQHHAAMAAATLIDGVVSSGPDGNRPLAQPSAIRARRIAPDRHEDGWDAADVEALRDAEPGQLLHAADSFAAIATARAYGPRGRLRADAAAAEQRAADLRREAKELRAQAAALRGRQASAAAAARLGRRRR